MWPFQCFIFSVVKFLWNRFSLRLFILLAFTFWSHDLAVFWLKLCSEVVLLLTRFILFSREFNLFERFDLMYILSSFEYNKL